MLPTQPYSSTRSALCHKLASRMASSTLCRKTHLPDPLRPHAAVAPPVEFRPPALWPMPAVPNLPPDCSAAPGPLARSHARSRARRSASRLQSHASPHVAPSRQQRCVTRVSSNTVYPTPRRSPCSPNRAVGPAPQ